MKTTRRIITIALALALIFAFAAPSFALQTSGYVPTENGAAKYTQLADSYYEQNGTFTVYLSIYSGTNNGVGPIDRTVAVTMGSSDATGEKYSIYDVFNAAKSQYTYLDFDTTTPNQYHQSWLQGVKDTGVNSNTWFTAEALKYSGTTYYCGWMFRINGMIPYKYGNSNTACLITDAYVTAGDTVDLYFSNVYTQALSTKVFSVVCTGTDNGVSTFQVLYSDCYVPSGQYDWTVTTWNLLADVDVDIRIDGTVESISIDEDGEFTLTGLSGSHSFQFDPLSIPYYYTQNNVNYYYYVPYYAGMYSVYNF